MTRSAAVRQNFQSIFTSICHSFQRLILQSLFFSHNHTMPRQPSTHPDAVRTRARRALAKARVSPPVQGSLRASPEAVRLRRCADTERARVTRRAQDIEQRRSSQSCQSLQHISSYRPHAIKNPWRASPCNHCGATLLAAENPKWCCNEGKNVLDPLPPLTPGLQSLMSVSRICKSSASISHFQGAGSRLAVTVTRFATRVQPLTWFHSLCPSPWWHSGCSHPPLQGQEAPC